MLLASFTALVEHGIVILKTDAHTGRFVELVDNRVLIQEVPGAIAHRPDGPIDAEVLASLEKETVRRGLSLLPFFTHPDVSRLFSPIDKHVDHIGRCQAKSQGCNHNLVTASLDNGGAVRLCWHHDLHREEVPNLDEIGAKNLITFRCNAIAAQLHGRVLALTIPELFWWAVRNEVYHALPEKMVAKVLGQEETRRRVGQLGTKDTNARYTQQSAADVMEKLSKPVLKLVVDDDPPMLYMRKPKPTTYTSDSYLAFVRKLPCVINGPGTDRDPIVAHHLIGHGEGKMAGKAHDLFTIPMRASEHRKFHDDPKGWESRHGSQLLHLKNTLKKAFDVGAIV